jgi:glycosyltransferase involved in cell wall biosynthesis
MVNSISFCIPSKDNLRYLKSSIKSITEFSTFEHEIIVWVDSDNDGTTDFIKQNYPKVKLLINKDKDPKGIAYGYNRCIENAKHDIVCMFHADMFMGKGFDVNILKHLKPNTVVAGTRIEPPLHPEGKEKIVKDFGMYPEDFKEKEFHQFIEEQKSINKDKTTKGIFAPWACYKNEILEMGMHDETFHSYHEDSDIFNRFILKGMEIKQSRDAFVYHLTCRGGKFQDGIEKVTVNAQFHEMKERAFKYYLKKWGCWIKNDEYHYPTISPVYKKSIITDNLNPQLKQILEPWFNGGEDIVVTIKNTFTEQDFGYIQQLNDIIKDSGQVGEFELGNLNIKINSLQEYQHDLVHL